MSARHHKVADSDPEREWYESLNKAEAQIAALQLEISDDE